MPSPSWSNSPAQTQNWRVKEWPVSILKDSENSSRLAISSLEAVKILDDFKASISAEELCTSKNVGQSLAVSFADHARV